MNRTVRRVSFSPCPLVAHRLRNGRAVVFCFLVLAGGMGLGGLLSSRADDWPQFLGPTRNGVSQETGLLDHWPTNGPPLVWEKPVGAGYGAPSVRGAVLVLHHRRGDGEIVEAMSAASGRTLWRHADPVRFRDPYGYNNGPRCTPLLTTNRCYTFGAAGRLLCLNLADGRMIWARETSREWRVPPAFFGVGSSPLLEGNRLIVMVGGQPEAGVVALDPATGRTLWESVGRSTWDGATTLGWPSPRPYVWTGKEQQASYASPVAATFHGRRHLLCFMRQGLVSLDPADGSVRFKRWFRARVRESVNAMTPVIADGAVLISAAYYRVGAVLLRPGAEGHSFTEVWRSPPSPTARDTQTGRLAEPALEIHWSTPIVREGFIYAFNGRSEFDASLRCVEWRTGRVRWNRDESWRRRRAAQPPVYGRGSMICAEGRLIVLGEGGRVGLFRPDSRRPSELSAWQVPPLHYPCWTAPILAHRKLYLRGEDRLLCFDLAARNSAR